MDLKYALRSPGPGLLESGVELKRHSTPNTSKHENSSFAKSHFESRKEVCMTIICIFMEVYPNIVFLCTIGPHNTIESLQACHRESVSVRTLY